MFCNFFHCQAFNLFLIEIIVRRVVVFADFPEKNIIFPEIYLLATEN